MSLEGVAPPHHSHKSVDSVTESQGRGGGIAWGMFQNFTKVKKERKERNVNSAEISISFDMKK